MLLRSPGSLFRAATVAFATLVSVLGAAASCSDGGSATGSPATGETGGADSGASGDASSSEPDAGTLIADGGAAISLTGDVSIVVEPSDNEAALLAAIKGAKKSVHVTMYLLTDSSVESALNASKALGVDVQVVLNQSFPAGQGNDNQAAYDYFTKNGVKVEWASSAYTYTHQKTVIIDGTYAWIMTMNATYSSPTSNREFLVVDHDPEDVADAEKIFAADFARKPITLTTKLVVSPQTGATPDARTRMLAIISGATKSLDVTAEELSDTGVVSALVAKQKAGVAVRIVVSGSSTPSYAQQTAVASLKAAGVSVRSLAKPDMHAKALIADGVRAYVGSQNFTQTSLEQNRELGVLVGNATEVAKISTTFAGDFTAATAL